MNQGGFNRETNTRREGIQQKEKAGVYFPFTISLLQEALNKLDNDRIVVKSTKVDKVGRV